MIESLFRDRTVSWVQIVNGINKYVTETSETIAFEIFEHKEVTVKPVAKAKPQLKPPVTLSPVDDQSVEEIRCNLDKPRFVPYKNTWKPHQNIVLVRFEACSEEKIAARSRRS